MVQCSSVDRAHAEIHRIPQESPGPYFNPPTCSNFANKYKTAKEKHKELEGLLED